MGGPVAAQVSRFIDYLSVERGLARNTLEAYRRDLAAYQEFLTGRGLAAAAVTEGVVEDYLAFLRAAGRAPASVARALVSVRSLHRFLVQEKSWLTDPQFSASIAIAQAAPGPNVLICSLIGWRAAGMPGAIVALVAVCAPAAVLS